ncbi:MAG: galactitol-1-phosphate 5-dehydrogenase [Clostridiales bacterium]|nr:galactitol-1-phosphate 5-dehydrogenase [Clostridiales bacterium]
MKAAVLYANDDLRYDDYPMPRPGKGEVLVKVRATGICGSDVPRVLHNGAHFYPIVLGHEFSGEIVELGEGVEGFSVGDRVAGAPLIPCFQCNHCQKGSYSLCKSYSFIGSRVQGSFAQYIKLNARNAVKMDSNVSFEQGALIEPSTVALHGIRRVSYKGGKDVAVLGGGTIGLFTAQWAKIFGAKRVVVFDIDNDRLKLAERLGADYTINTMEEGFLDKAFEITKGEGFDYIFETAGAEPTIKMVFELAGNNSSACLIGTPTRELHFSPQLFEMLLRREFFLTGSWMSYSAPFPGEEWELTAHYFSNGELKIDEGMIFKKLPLSQAKKAFDYYKIPGKVKGKILLLNE